MREKCSREYAKNNSPSSPMKIALFGVGALASLYAEKLHPHGNVILFGNNSFLIEALRKRGFKAFSLKDSVDFRADLIIFLVKSHQTKDYASFLSSHLALNGVVLTLQNGQGNQKIISRSLAKEPCHTGITFQAAFQESQETVRIVNEGPVFLPLHPSLKRTYSLFSLAGIPVKAVKDIKGVLWSKLILNSAINPLTALFEVKNGDLITSPILASMASQLARESFAVAQSLGVCGMFFKTDQDVISYLFNTVCQTAKNISSMLQDKKRNRETEIDFINGVLVRQAPLVGVPAPLNTLMCRYIKSSRSFSLRDFPDKFPPFETSDSFLR